MPSIREAIDTLKIYMSHSLAQVSVDELNTSDRKRLAVFCFGFGGVHAIAQKYAFSPMEAEAVALIFFRELFEMSPVDSAKVFQWCVNQTAGNSEWNPLVHEGIDAFLYWQEGVAPHPGERLKDMLIRLDKSLG